MQSQIITSNALREIRTQTDLIPPDNFISQKLSIKLFDFIPGHLTPQDLKAIKCLDKYWNKMSIIWLNSQEICCSSSKPNETSIIKKWGNAIQTGDLETIKVIIETDPSVLDKRYADNDNVCHLAVKFGHAHLVAYFHAHSKNLMSHLNNKGLSPFHLAISSDKRGIVEQICKKDRAIIRSTTLEGANGLQLAAMVGCHEMFIMLHSYDQELIHTKFAELQHSNMLHLAISAKNLQTIDWIIKNYPSQMSEPNDMGAYPIHLAIQSNSLKNVKILDKKRPALIKINPNKSTALHYACSPYSSFEIFDHVYKKYPRMRLANNSEGKQPIHIAIASNRLDIVRFYVQNYSKKILENKTNKEENPLHLASTLEMAQYLYMSDPSLLFDHTGISPMHTAAQQGNLDIVEFYLSKHQDLYALKDKDDNNILHFAALGIPPHLQTPEYKEKQIKLIRSLTNRYPVLLQSKNKVGKLSYMYAQDFVSKGIADEMNAALEKYACATIPGYSEMQNMINEATTYVSAFQTGDLETIREQCRKDPSYLYLKGSVGNNNAAHKAVEGGYLHIIEFIYEKHEELFSDFNNEGHTPFQLAVKQGKYDIVKFLCDKRKAFASDPNKNGSYPLQAAAYRGDYNLFELLYDINPELVHAKFSASHERNILFLAINGKGKDALAIIELICKNHPILVTEPDNLGINPIHHAACKAAIDIVKIFLHSNPDSFASKWKGSNLLHFAARGDAVKQEDNKNQIELIRFLTKNYPQLLQEKNENGKCPYNYAQEFVNNEIAFEMIAADVNYRKSLPVKEPVVQEIKPPMTEIPIPNVENIEEKNTELPSAKIATTASKKKKKNHKTKNAQTKPVVDAVLNENSLNIEKTSSPVIVNEEIKEINLPKESTLEHNEPNTSPEEPVSQKQEFSETEITDVKKTKKPSALRKMKSKVEDAWNNTVGLSSAEKIKRREERKLLHRESMSVSISQSDWSRSVRMERSEIEKSLAEGEFESLVEALQTNSKLDKKVMSETLQQLEKLNVIEIPNTNNDKVRANYTGECHGEKRPSLTIHKHNHDKDWDQQHRAQANFLTFINDCGLDTEEIKNQPMTRKNNTNDEPQDAGEG